MRLELVNIIEALPSVEVYLVGGPSGAGKTVFAQALAKRRQIRMISLDDYFLNENMVRFSQSSRYGRGRQWDHPSSVDLSLALRNIIELVTVKYSRVPIFDFSENRRVGFRRLMRGSNSSISVEGLHALLLQPQLEALSISTYSIFINCAVQVRRNRVKTRDMETRSRPLKEFDRRFHFMRLAEVRWILPQRFKANLNLDTSEGIFRILDE